MSNQQKEVQEKASEQSRETLAAWSQEKPDKDDLTIIITEEDYEPENLAKESRSPQVKEEKEKIYIAGDFIPPASRAEDDGKAPNARTVNAHEAGHPDSLSREPDDQSPDAHEINDHIATAREHYEERRENETPPANDDPLLYQKQKS